MTKRPEKDKAAVKIKELETELLPPTSDNATSTLEVEISEDDRRTMAAVLADQVRVARSSTG